MADIIAYHGWGFDRTCWQGWVNQWVPKGHQMSGVDRGYFGKAIRALFRESNVPHFSHDSMGDTCKTSASQRILILHSFGLHLCPLELIQLANTVVIFGGFLCFHPDEPQLNRRSKRVVKRMGDRVQTHPRDVLQQFWHNCYKPVLAPTIQTLGEINIKRLYQDLERLNTLNIDETSSRVTTLQLVPNIIVIHGESDQIVPLSQGATLADAVSAPLITVPDAGHALPFSHPDQCWTLPPFISL